MKVEAVYPKAGAVDLAEIWEALDGEPVREPFAPELIARCARFSQFLFRDPEARQYPELQSLAFWMRESAVTTLAREFAQQRPPRTVRTARGLVFHVPPSNVDTIFVYSWLLSTLCGNRNLLRLSSRGGGASDVLIRAFQVAAPDAADTWLVRYGRDTAVTEAISSRADVRIIWGGDATVETVRRIPLAPHARELTFPDRYSFAAIRTEAFLQLDEGAAAALLHQAYNDIYWFDQMACSSPHLVVWVGAAEEAREAGRRFFDGLVAECARRGMLGAIGVRMAKFTQACREAADGGVESWLDDGALTMIGAGELNARIRTMRQGGGLLWQTAVPDLEAVTPFLDRRDQTVSHFGFTAEELEAWVRQVGPRGVDRVVPIGQALQFDRVWDGQDLLADLTRLVRVESPKGKGSAA